jgi:16S rRNA (guanine527-N7)-methyltransferase
MIPETLFQYFPNLSEIQRDRFRALEGLYQDWNAKINVVSRKDIDELYLRHVLHSLGIAKVYEFQPGQQVLDVGTGGGFPGIPLAILFPETQFTLVDAIGKKIRVVEEVVAGLELSNVTALQRRVEDLTDTYDFIVSRAVAAMPTFVHWTRGRLKKGKGVPGPGGSAMDPGILYLKGGDLSGELLLYPGAKIFPLTTYFKEPFFETKKVVYLPDPQGKRQKEAPQKRG